MRRMWRCAEQVGEGNLPSVADAGTVMDSTEGETIYAFSIGRTSLVYVGFNLLFPTEYLTPAQCLEYVNSPIVRYTIREFVLVDHDAVIDAEIDMPAQCAMFVENVVGEPGGNLVNRAQDLCDGATRNGDCPVLQLRKNR